MDTSLCLNHILVVLIDIQKQHVERYEYLIFLMVISLPKIMEVDSEKCYTIPYMCYMISLFVFAKDIPGGACESKDIQLIPQLLLLFEPKQEVAFRHKKYRTDVSIYMNTNMGIFQEVLLAFVRFKLSSPCNLNLICLHILHIQSQAWFC
jgi:hypothetical protein